MAEKIHFTFLGTGSAIPTAKHNHPSLLLQYKDENILIDCGEGTQRQIRVAHLNPCKITKILITHWHGDHVLGLPGLLQTLMFSNYNKQLDIYGPKGTKKMTELYLSLFVGKSDQLKIQVHELENNDIIDEKDFFISCKSMSHDTESLAYSFNIKEKTRINKAKLKKLKIPNSPLIAQLLQGKTIEINKKKINPKNLLYKEQARKITIIMDTKFNQNAVNLAENSDILISEATYSAQEKELAQNHFHLTSADSAEIARKSHAKKLILTHLSQRYEINPKIILNEAKKIFKNTIIAEDFMKFEI